MIKTRLISNRILKIIDESDQKKKKLNCRIMKKIMSVPFNYIVQGYLYLAFLGQNITLK
jgi:hypothetical protein